MAERLKAWLLGRSPAQLHRKQLLIRHPVRSAALLGLIFGALIALSDILLGESVGGAVVGGIFGGAFFGPATVWWIRWSEGRSVNGD